MVPINLFCSKPLKLWNWNPGDELERDLAPSERVYEISNRVILRACGTVKCPRIFVSERLEAPDTP